MSTIFHTLGVIGDPPRTQVDSLSPEAIHLNGFLIIDKPLGITSRDAVDRVMKALPKDARVGHTGTLDPLASGVLVLALGQATRLADYVQA